MTIDPYSEVLDRVWTKYSLPPTVGERDRLAAEIEDRRGLQIEQSQRVDLPSELSYAVKLIDQDGRIVAYGHGEHPRQAAIDALVRLINGKHGREY